MSCLVRDFMLHTPLGPQNGQESGKELNILPFQGLFSQLMFYNPHFMSIMPL